MVYELHVWGPAFGLSSFDAECIGAIAYLQCLLPTGLWVLVAACDPSANPAGDFPALHDDDQWVAGFSAIVSHLARNGYSLDSHISQRQRADLIALTAHLSLHAPPLVSHHLHTSPSAYTHITLPAISRTLPTSLTYTTTSLLHDLAISRAALAGLSFVDDQPSLTTRSGAQNQSEAGVISTNSPSLLFSRRKGVQEALEKEQMKLRFRVEAAIETLLEPLAAMLDQQKEETAKSWSYVFGGKSPNSIDCLAFGYLSLLLYPAVPNPWLQASLRKRYPIVAKYVEELRQDLQVNGAVNNDSDTTTSPSSKITPSSPSTPSDHKAQPQAHKPSGLPWRTLNPASTTETLHTALSHLLYPYLHTHHLLHPSLIFKNSPFLTSSSFWTPTILPSFLLTLSAPLLAILGLGYFLFTSPADSMTSFAQWWSFGGGERDKVFKGEELVRSRARDSFGGVGVSDFGDAEDVLGALFGGLGPMPSGQWVGDGGANGSVYGDVRQEGSTYDGRERERRKQDGEEGVKIVDVDWRSA